MQIKHINNDFKIRQQRIKTTIKNHFFDFLKKNSAIHLINNKKKNTLKSKIKNICLSSGLERSTNSNLFRASRHVVKKNATKLEYPGIRKASW